MRFFRPIIVALAATSTAVNANALKQHHQERALIDVCANVDANLKILGLVLGKLDLCLCVSAIPQLLKVNLLLRTAVTLVGESVLTGILTGLINAASDHKTCHYPDHAVPHCSSDPCDFTCKDGFTPSPASHPTSCVCKAPNTVCNGVCGHFPHCSSQKAKRDASWRDATCPLGWSACGVWGGQRLDYECVDVRKDLWSCGGCGLPLMPTDPTGVDCTAIAGVHDVACISGRCAVERCKDGFNISSDRTSCVPTTRMRPNNPVFVNNGNGPFKA